LPELKDTESLSVQLQTVRLNGASTYSLVENLVQMALKFSEDIQQLRKDNEYLKFHLNRLNNSVPGPSVHTIRPSPSVQGSCTFAKEVLPLKTAEYAICSASACDDSGTKSYKDAVSASLKPSNSGATSDGFTSVTYKKKPSPASVPENTTKHRR
jgi:hypothetical protein